MNTLIERVLGAPWRTLFLMLLIVAAAGSGASRLQLSTDMEVFFSEDDPQLLAYDAVRNTYTRDDNLFLGLAPADGVVFKAETLALIEEITERAWQIPHALRVDSITNYQHTRAVDDDLSVQPLIQDALNLSPAQIDAAREVAINEPLLRGQLITADASVTAINITMAMPAEGRSAAIREAVRAVRALRDEVQSRHPDFGFYISGKTAGNNAFTEAAVQDMTQIVPLAVLVALVLIAGYLYYASRNIVTAVASTLATVVVIFSAIAVGMGMAGWIGYKVTPPVANAPTIILTLAVADCMHLLVNFFLARRRGEPAEAAMRHSLKVNFQAVSLTSITTVIGFLALNFSDAPPFRDLGNIVAVGIVAAWLFSLSILPALMIKLPSKVNVDAEGDLRLMTFLADSVIARPRRSAAFVLILIGVAAAGLPQNRLYDIWAEYFDHRTEIRRDSDFTREHLSGFNSLEFSIGAGEAGGIADPAYLQTLSDFADFLAAQPEVNHVSHFGLIMQRLNRNMHGDDPAWYRLPDDRELAAQYLLLYEFSLPFGLDLTNMVNLDKSATRVRAGLRTSSTLELMALQERAGAWLRENAPEAAYHPGASSDAMFAHIGKRNVYSMVIGSLLGLLAISLVISLALRSLRFGLLSLMLNLLPLAVGFGVWGWLVSRVGLGLSVVSGLTMGIVVDYTVHLLTKYRLAQRERNEDTPAAIRYAFANVGVALLVTTVVLGVNFGLLGFSVFQLNAEMGLLTAFIIVVALIIDLLFLPPVLLWLDRDKTRETPVLAEAAEPAT